MEVIEAYLVRSVLFSILLFRPTIYFDNIFSRFYCLVHLFVILYQSFNNLEITKVV